MSTSGIEFYSKQACGMGDNESNCIVCRNVNSSSWRRRMMSMFSVGWDSENWECPRKDRPWGYLPERIRRKYPVSEIRGTRNYGGSNLSSQIDSEAMVIRQKEKALGEYQTLKKEANESGDPILMSLVDKVDEAYSSKKCFCIVNSLVKNLREAILSKRGGK